MSSHSTPSASVPLPTAARWAVVHSPLGLCHCDLDSVSLQGEKIEVEDTLLVIFGDEAEGRRHRRIPKLVQHQYYLRETARRRLVVDNTCAEELIDGSC